MYISMGENPAVSTEKIHYVKTDSSLCYPPKKSCPMKFGTAVNNEGLLFEIPCTGKECAWFLK
jgi:hypothetical protein